MGKLRRGEKQAVFALKQAETGAPILEVLRQLKLLEEENRKLEQLAADLNLDKHILQDMLAKNCGIYLVTCPRSLGSGSARGERAARRRPVRHSLPLD
ncbi:UNVERIFIED_ORG: hypothetical protein M2438_002775 [Methylobacterium sp. SuP10 SLI 274]|nr:hypothetical protein [Methylorubrum extorquens]MDF9792315.1 hypothetical protein [Methylorubrum extorquens]MDF9864007.1 hypothetical protein [Methylorubrum pseudosasae]MDH6637600.1 hypothetical protein [Methylobacterium sp. SuP10 SLI 274]MDH6666779.1 hypothetical protein [Methylorubrum zatmanii]